MLLRRKLATFVRMTSGDRGLILEAMVMLGLARLAVVTLPFRIIAAWASRAPDRGTADPKLLVRVRAAVTNGARNVPWNAVCLPQAIAAKAMLARRGCGSTFHLGATLDPKGKLSAHAWLVVGDTIVVGAAGVRGMTPLARFG